MSNYSYKEPTAGSRIKNALVVGVEVGVSTAIAIGVTYGLLYGLSKILGVEEDNTSISED